MNGLFPIRALVAAVLTLAFLAGCPEGAGDAPAASISGTITVADPYADRPEPTDVLFIMARKRSPGPPLAVLRVSPATFPLEYELTPANVMFQGMVFEGDVAVEVRLDKDGNASTKGPGDLKGVYARNPATVGDTGVDIVLDRLAEGT